jgi:transposase
MSKQSITDKQLIAKLLFTREQLDQKVVAKKVRISEKTMSKWVNQFNWKSLRRRLLITKEEQLNNFFEQLETLNNEIRESAKKRPDTKQADVQRKLTASIKDLQTELGIEAIVETGILYIKYLQKAEPVEEVIKETDRWHCFIQASIKK